MHGRISSCCHPWDAPHRGALRPFCFSCLPFPDALEDKGNIILINVIQLSKKVILSSISVKHAYPYKDRERYRTLDCKHDLSVFPLGPDPAAVPIEEQLSVLVFTGAYVNSVGPDYSPAVFVLARVEDRPIPEPFGGGVFTLSHTDSLAIIIQKGSAVFAFPAAQEGPVPVVQYLSVVAFPGTYVALSTRDEKICKHSCNYDDQSLHIPMSYQHKCIQNPPGGQQSSPVSGGYEKQVCV